MFTVRHSITTTQVYIILKALRYIVDTVDVKLSYTCKDRVIGSKETDVADVIYVTRRSVQVDGRHGSR